MATLVFAGTTLWNDASTGVGRLQVIERGRQSQRVESPVVGGVGVFSTQVYVDLGGATVGATYHVSDEGAAVVSAWAGLVGSVGSLVWRGRTLTNCVLLGFDTTRTSVLGNGSKVFELVAEFRKIG